ncbi:hypothetical protein DV735_g4693, partial [Chaetothyriales sp. CBS 134920]
MATTTTKTGQPLDRASLDSLLRRRLFYTPSFDIYGGERGLYDYGPPGCALQANVVDLWRKHFVLEEDMLELDCTMLTPEAVLKTSGHVDKFADWMCKDPKSGEIFRADHLVEGVLEARLKADKEARGQIAHVDEAKDAKKKKKVKDAKVEKLDDAVVQEYEETLAKIDNYGGDELGQLITKFGIKGPTTGAELDPPKAFNLMFRTQIGPSADQPNGYLRPETAQGQFLNFHKLLEFNQQAMPFASASIGKSFRNEISPRSGLLRVREFLMAEIEHFVDPEGGKTHPRFDEVKDVSLALLNRETQLSGHTDVEQVTVGHAVATKLIDNETLGYFLVRIQDFLLKLGVDKSKLRFRQHMANEMAHYAADCWDAELLTSYGWIECVGCADRSAYDLTVHKNKTGAPLLVRETRAQPLVVEEFQVDLDKKKLGPKFRKDAKAVEAAVEALSQEVREKLAIDLDKTGKITIDTPGIGSGKTDLDKDLIQIEKRKRTEHIREYTPNVIEPSFGIGRILYTLMEHVYWTREGDDARGVLSFPPPVAPTKVLIVPLSNHADFKPFISKLTTKLRRLGISNKTDDSSASIGKRYARNDELGTPLGITIDFQTVKDNSITLRDRDSTKQVRASEDEIVAAIKALVDGEETWTDVQARLPAFEGQDLDKESATTNTTSIMPPRAPSASHPDPTRPSLSPSLGLEARAPVRRNLFSAHLSRRSGSSTTQTPPLDVSTSHSASNGANHAQHPSLFSPPQPSITPASPFASRPPQLHPSFSAAQGNLVSDPFAAAAPAATRPPASTLAYPTTAAPTDRDEEVLEAQRQDARINAMMTRYRSRQYAKRAAHPTAGRSRRHQRAQGQQDGDEELAEEEELMNQLRSALRKEVYRAEEECWMFGEVERGRMRGGRIDQDSGGMVMGGSAAVGIAYE